MRKFFLSLFCLMVTVAVTNAQDVILGRKSPTDPLRTVYDERIQFDKAYSGYIVTTANDTIRGELTVPNPNPEGKQPTSGAMVLMSAQKGVHFTSAANPKASKQYLPEQLKGMQMEDIVFEAQEISETGLKNDKKMFLLPRVADGRIKLFLLYSYYNSTNHDSGGKSGVCEPNFCIKVGSEQTETTVGLKFMNFRKAMGKYVTDCPAVAQKVEAKTYQRDQLEAIVREYNSCSGVASSK